MLRKGLVWNSVEKFGGKAVSLGVSIVLARLLSPEDFGVIATLLVFSQLATVIQESGFRQALIRESQLSSLQCNSVFYINIGIGVVLYGILYFCAPYISLFYSSPELTTLARVLFLTLPLNSLGVVQASLLNKKCDFVALARCSVLASVISGLIAIILATDGHGVWSLVYQQIIMSVVYLGMLQLSSSWSPQLDFDLTSTFKLFRFSKNILISGVVDSLVSNAQTVIIGKSYPTAELGFYSQGKQFASIPAQTLTSVLNQVSYPFLVNFQENNELLKHNYRQILLASVLSISSIMLFLAATGESLITLILGVQWQESIPYFQLLALGGSIFPLYTLGNNVLWVKGEGSIFLKLSIAKRIITIVAIAISLNHGPKVLVAAGVVAAALNSLLTLHVSGQVIGYSLKEQLRNLSPAYITALFGATVAYISGICLDDLSHLSKFFAQSTLGLCCFLILNLALNRRIVSDLISFLSHQDVTHHE